MPSISYDGQSFSIDGRRIWIVSGAIHYARTPHELWPERIAAAKQAGLNCIETYVFWNFHEPVQGKFNFEGDANLRRFLALVHDAGMYAIVRPGPYVCAEWDFGGLPAWLTTVPNMKLREGSLKRNDDGPFLEGCSRYLTAVMEQIGDLQITEPGGGPIIMIQAENEYLCSNDEQAEAYLKEIVRYLRENGCNVPINECNNLWQKVEGAISTWNAKDHLVQDLRQFRLVQPNAPRVVTEFWPGWFDKWGGEHASADDASLVQYRLAQILAAGAQYNLYMFHGGTNFGFWGGRSIAGDDCFMTTSYDYDAPLLEAGGRGEKYDAVKRISTFASQFGHVFAHLDPDQQHVSIAPVEQNHTPAVIHQTGSQGEVVFIFRSDKDKTKKTSLLLTNGLTLPVTLGSDRVIWLLLNANLGGVAELTYSNLRPWAFVDNRMLVLYGPAGSDGLVAIDSAPVEVKVPSGRKPLVEQHEEITLVIVNDKMIDTAQLDNGTLLLNCASIGLDGEPSPASGTAITRVSADGTVKTSKLTATRRSSAPRLEDFEQSDCYELLDGTSPTYKEIKGAASLEALGQPYGYGWYKIEMKAPGAGKVMAPQAGDRLHVFDDRKRTALLGKGPSAEDEPVDLKLPATTTVLCDNLGRFNFGWHVGEKKGIWGDLHHVKPVKLSKPKVESGIAPDIFELGGFFNGMRRDERPAADALVWSVKPSGRKPLILDIKDLPMACVIAIGETPVAAYHPAFCAGFQRIVLTPGEEITGGQNELRLELFSKYDKANLSKHVTLYQSTEVLTDKATWSFAKWELPGDDAWKPMNKTTQDQPCWYRANFRVPSARDPLWLDAKGLSKGQIFLNGHNCGRYFVATHTGKAVGPQTQYYLPEPWLNVGDQNELVIFDEHGKQPTSCKLVYEPMGPYHKK